MAAQVEFFCTPAEEAQVLAYLGASGDVFSFPVALQDPETLVGVDLHVPPEWPVPFDIYIWLRSAGPLKWHTDVPRVSGVQHGELVSRLFAWKTWQSLAPRGREA